MEVIMATDKEIIDAMNLIKKHCKGRICPACACWNEEDKKCIVDSRVEPSEWKTEKAKIVD